MDLIQERSPPTDFTKWFHKSHLILSSNSLNCLTSTFHLYCIATLGQSYNKNDEKDVHISEEPFTKKRIIENRNYQKYDNTVQIQIPDPELRETFKYWTFNCLVFRGHLSKVRFNKWSILGHLK